MKYLTVKNEELNKIKRKYTFIEQYFNLKAPTTYTDNTDFIQCDSGRGRSFNDLWKLFKGKFKSAKQKELANIVLKLEKENKVRIMYCSDIRETVIHSVLLRPNYWSFYEDTKPHETIRNGKTVNLSYNEILKLAEND